MVEKSAANNPSLDEVTQLASTACSVVGRLHDAVLELVENEIEKAGLPFLPCDANEINEAILGLLSDLIYALPGNQNSCLVKGLPQIIEMWRKSQTKVATSVSCGYLRLVKS